MLDKRTELRLIALALVVVAMIINFSFDGMFALVATSLLIVAIALIVQSRKYPR